MSHSSRPLPSESRRARVLLYLGEGLVIGGLLAMVGPVLVAGAVLLVGSDGAVVPTAALAVVALFAVAALYTLSGLALGRGRSPDRSPSERDWHRTRRWRWVLVVALVAFAAVSLTSLALGGSGRIAPPSVGRLSAVAVLFAGLGLLTYAWRRFGAV